MSTRQLRSTDKAVLQIAIKAAYDLRCAEMKFRSAKLAYFSLTSVQDSFHQLIRYSIADGRRDAVRETVADMLRICAAMPPARRREAWVAFRSGWRAAGKSMRGGVR